MTIDIEDKSFGLTQDEVFLMKCNLARENAREQLIMWEKNVEMGVITESMVEPIRRSYESEFQFLNDDSYKAILKSAVTKILAKVGTMKQKK